MVSDYLNRIRSDEDILSDLRAAVDEAERRLAASDAALQAADALGDYGGVDHAANASRHWEKRATYLRDQVADLEDHIALRNAASDRRYRG
jgi:hypothetical protein